jgi:hypothetical protein
MALMFKPLTGPTGLGGDQDGAFTRRQQGLAQIDLPIHFGQRLVLKPQVSKQWSGRKTHLFPDCADIVLLA